MTTTANNNNDNMAFGGVAEWVEERWSRQVNFPYPAPDC